MSSRGPRQPGAAASFGTLFPLAYPQGPVDLDPLLRPALARRTQQLDRSFDQHVRLTARLSRTVQVADRGAQGAGVSPRGCEAALERALASYGARVAHAPSSRPNHPSPAALAVLPDPLHARAGTFFVASMATVNYHIDLAPLGVRHALSTPRTLTTPHAVASPLEHPLSHCVT